MPEEKPSAAVVATPKRAEEITWMEASVWTPRMIEALDKGVEGGRWCVLLDKVHRKENLKVAYERTKRNKCTGWFGEVRLVGVLELGRSAVGLQGGLCTCGRADCMCVSV